jgi:hypothetical protein
MDEFGKRLLAAIGGEDDFFSGSRNPVSDALKDENFVETYKDLPGFNRRAVCRVAILCQMAVYDRMGGPEGDRQPKGQRRHWYSYFKSEVAQPFAMQLGDYQVNGQGIKEINDVDWSSRLSTIYGELVDSGSITYKDLWIEDASRMFDKMWQALFEGLHLLICVEKDSLFADFKAASEALGAKALYSGKGKSSKAAIEKVLREAFGWSEWNNPFTYENPLVVLHISDHDYDGEAVIGPTFAEQARRYTDCIVEGRIGVNPQDVKNLRTWEDAWYTIKISNKSYQVWADEKAIFQGRCTNCYSEVSFESKVGVCPNCSEMVYAADDATPHGFEVESLRTRDYYSLIADAFMRVIPFEYTVSKLREECTADTGKAANEVAQDILGNNQSYQLLLEELAKFDEMVAAKEAFERKVRDELINVADSHKSDWEDEEDDPEPDDLRRHMINSSGRSWGSVWRPFSIEVRTDKMVEWIRDEQQDLVDDLTNEELTW